MGPIRKRGADVRRGRKSLRKGAFEAPCGITSCSLRAIAVAAKAVVDIHDVDDAMPWLRDY